MSVSGNFCSSVVSTGFHTSSQDVCSAAIRDINAGSLESALAKLTTISDVFSRTFGLIKFANYCIEQNKPEETSRAADRIPEGYHFDQYRDYIFERLTNYWIERKDYEKAYEYAKKGSDISKITSLMNGIVGKLIAENRRNQAERMVEFLPSWIKNDLLKR